MLVGAIIATGYVFANDIEPEEVVFAMGSATEQAQDFVSDVDFEDTGAVSYTHLTLPTTPYV